MPPFPNKWRVGLTFDIDLWPTDLNINRDHLLIKDYLPTKFEASGAKRSRVIRCTRFERLTWPLTLTFDLLTWLSIGIIYSSRTIYLPSLKLLGQSVVELSVAQGLEDWHDLWPWPLTWLSIGIIYSSRTIYLPSLKLLGQSVVELSVAQGLEDWHDLWPWPLTYWPDYQEGSSTHQGLSTYQVWSFWGKALLSYPLHKVWKTDMTFDLDLWPTDLTINRDHLLIKDYLPTKSEASGAKRCWVIRCTRFGRLTWPLTLTFDLLTWLSIGIIYSSRTIYLPSLKLLGESVLELSVAQG